MAADPFARMHKTLFATLGKEGFLRTGEACRIEMRNNETLLGEDGTVVAYRTTAEIYYADLPRPRAGDAVTIGTDTYALDFVLEDDGYTARWVVV